MSSPDDVMAVALLFATLIAALAVVGFILYGVWVVLRALAGAVGALLFGRRRHRARIAAHPYGSPETHPALTARRGRRG